MPPLGQRGARDAHHNNLAPRAARRQRVAARFAACRPLLHAGPGSLSLDGGARRARSSWTAPRRALGALLHDITRGLGLMEELPYLLRLCAAPCFPHPGPWGNEGPSPRLVTTQTYLYYALVTSVIINTRDLFSAAGGTLDGFVPFDGVGELS